MPLTTYGQISSQLSFRLRCLSSFSEVAPQSCLATFASHQVCFVPTTPLTPRALPLAWPLPLADTWSVGPGCTFPAKSLVPLDRFTNYPANPHSPVPPLTAAATTEIKGINQKSRTPLALQASLGEMTQALNKKD